MARHNLEKLAAIFETRRDRSMVDYMSASPEERAHMDRVLIERDRKRNEEFKKRLNSYKDKGVSLYNDLVGKK